MRILKRVLLILLIVLLLAVGGFTAWAYTPLGPLPEAVAALQPDAAVQVTTSPWLTFTPASSEPTTGFIFYPGGRVDARSYAPATRAIAERGYLVVIPPVPFNLAVFKPAAASGDRRAPGDPTLGDRRALAGGTMALTMFTPIPMPYTGISALGGLPGRQQQPGRPPVCPSSRSTAPTMGWRQFEVGATRTLLPPDTRYLAIAGGNHAQMGWYGPQGGDGVASISRAAQQAQVVDATVALLARLGN